jgi:hypothetical protein
MVVDLNEYTPEDIRLLKAIRDELETMRAKDSRRRSGEVSLMAAESRPEHFRDIVAQVAEARSREGQANLAVAAGLRARVQVILAGVPEPVDPQVEEAIVRLALAAAELGKLGLDQS